MNLIILRRDEVGRDGRVVLDGRRGEHIIKVLKSVPGDTLKTGLINGPRGAGLVEAVEDSSVVLVCRWEDERPRVPVLDVILAMPRPKVLRRLWSPLASWGVRNLYLVNAAKVDPSYWGTHWIRPEYYTPLLVEGLEQCGETWLPSVRMVRHWRSFLGRELDGLFPAGRRLAAHPGADNPVQSLVIGSEEQVLLAIGPEGGWTAEEIETMGRRNFGFFRIGDRVLRSDVACLTAMSAVCARRLA